MDQHISQDEIRQIIISDMVKERNSIVLLAYHLMSRETLKWIHRASLDETSSRSTFGCLQGKKARREEGSKVIRRYTLLSDIEELPHETGLIASRKLCLGKIEQEKTHRL